MANKKGCFVADSLVELIDGRAPIQDLRVGDSVLSYNSETKTNEEKDVTAVYRPLNSKSITIKIVGPSYIDDITCTPDHPIVQYLSGSIAGVASFDVEKTKEDYGFPTVSLLQKGTEFLTVTHESAQVYEIVENEDNSQETYLIEVEGNSNYFVNGCLVHNKNL